jgi:D-amino-acid dehydrogenase
MHTNEQHVMVIGAGVVGLTSACWLIEAGFRVTVLEREAGVGHGASRCNGGQLAYRYASPLADAGVPLKALNWLLQSDGPMRFRPEADLRQWRWLGAFLRHCSAKANRRTTARLLRLAELSRTEMDRLGAVPHASFSWREPGKLVVYRGHPGFDTAVARLAAGHGAEVLTAAECAEREPALAAARAELVGGIFTPGEAVADCHAFCEALAARLQAHPRFVGIIRGEASSIVAEHGKVVGLDTSAGRLHADGYVLAAGIASRTLAATAGIALPLYPLKGYSLSAPILAKHCAPNISVTDFDRKVLYARIGDRLRVAAMVDMVGEDVSLDPKRVAGLTREVRETMPDGADYRKLTAWAGLRPATPDGAPVIGATGYPNLWLNVGHGALGFTLACGSASLLADLMCGQPTPIPMDGLGLRR